MASSTSPHNNFVYISPNMILVVLFAAKSAEGSRVHDLQLEKRTIPETNAQQMKTCSPGSSVLVLNIVTAATVKRTQFIDLQPSLSWRPLLEN